MGLSGAGRWLDWLQRYQAVWTAVAWFTGPSAGGFAIAKMNDMTTAQAYIYAVGAGSVSVIAYAVWRSLRQESEKVPVNPSGWPEGSLEQRWSSRIELTVWEASALWAGLEPTTKDDTLISEDARPFFEVLAAATERGTGDLPCRPTDNNWRYVKREDLIAWAIRHNHRPYFLFPDGPKPTPTGRRIQIVRISVSEGGQVGGPYRSRSR
jgi:hypothetical protein